MAIDYKFEIHKINALVESQGKENLVTRVHYTYSGSKEVEGITYSDHIGGTQSFEYSEGQDFTPYTDTEDFERIVVGWLEAALDLLELQSRISEGIDKKVTPVDNDLYFTWQEA
jgi:hypothetical protein